MAAILDTTPGICCRSKGTNILKDIAMLKRLNDINTLPDKDKEYILYTIDGLLNPLRLELCNQ